MERKGFFRSITIGPALMTKLRSYTGFLRKKFLLVEEDQIEVLGDPTESGKPSVEYKVSHGVSFQAEKNVATSEYCE